MFDIIIQVYGEHAKKERDFLCDSIAASGGEFLMSRKEDRLPPPTVGLVLAPDNFGLEIIEKSRR